MRTPIVLSLLLAGSVAAPSARADEPPAPPPLVAPPPLAPPPVAPPPVALPPAPPPRAPALRVSWPLDISLAGGGAALWIGSQLLEPVLAPSTCRWCDTNLNDLDRSVKVSLRWNNTKLADTLSNVTGFGLTPIAMFGLQLTIDLANKSRPNEWLKDVVVLTESVALAMDFNQLIKFIAGRQRPFIRDPGPGDPHPPANPADNNVSFFSGHTTSGFVFAVSAGTIASLRGYRAAPVIWVSGLTLATMTAYLRLAADRHYFSDVITGALIGSAVGVLVPWLHRPCPGQGPCVNGVTAAPVKNGAGLGLVGVF